eukprot:2929780-Pleurochrysis_carterae.AAC.2
MGRSYDCRKSRGSDGFARKSLSTRTRDTLMEEPHHKRTSPSYLVALIHCFRNTSSGKNTKQASDTDEGVPALARRHYAAHGSNGSCACRARTSDALRLDFVEIEVDALAAQD